jgi:hypothetical protein
MNRPTILLINPMFNIVKLITTIIDSGKNNLDYCIVLTAKTIIATPDINLAQYSDCVTVLDLKTEEWNFDINFVSGISFDYNGQVLLESVSNQILLKNPGTQDLRLSKFLSVTPNTGDMLIETISYQGRHVAIAGWKFLEDKHLGLQTEFDQVWVDQIEKAFETLDNAKIINGPAQVYFNVDSNVIGIKMHPSNIRYAQQKTGTSRHWLDIWQTITALQSTNPISAQRKFYDWIDGTGTAKAYKATTLTL